MNIEKFKNKKIGVLYGGTSSEREISLKSGAAVLKALKSLRINACGIDFDKNAAQTIKREKIDAAFIVLHGKCGEDGTVQGLLETLCIPYAGSGVLASAASMDKNISKILFKSAGLLTPDWFVLRKLEPFPEKINYPVVVKPSRQGSAIGVSIVKSKKDFAKAVKEAFKYDGEIIVEQFIKGKEITAGVLNATALPVVEIVPKGKFYDFKSKYQIGGSRHIIPARIDGGIYKEAQSAAVKIFKTFNCRAVCRVDMIIGKDGKIWILENNTIPGMTETSLLPDAAKAAGLSFEELVLEILKTAFDS
ncbi:MAG: D-alanine--D-alanine ligase [Endomicrobium sp.]|jgi:D-alanine-D-alanine ligase|nr:D-alanine--D-alanine ligase [Endomicrobium sp.]